MKILSTFYLLLTTILITSLFLSSCGDTKNEKEVDREYLESGQYQSFAEDTRRESERRTAGSLQARLQRLPECRDIPMLQLSLDMDEDRLDNLLHDDPGHCPELESAAESEGEIRVVGRLSDSTPEAWLVLVEPLSVYKNRELVIATAVDGELMAFESVALYQENLSRDISTELLIENNGEIHLTAISHRKITYPIEQESTERARFVIRGDGSIEKE